MILQRFTPQRIKRRWMVAALVAAGLVVFVVLAAPSSSWLGAHWQDRIESLRFAATSRHVRMHDTSGRLEIGPSFVGVAAIPEGFALVDYSNLYCLDAGTGLLRRVRPIIGDRPPGMWVPTGLAYDAAAGHLFVANYLGNEVYEGRLNCGDAAFSIVSRIASDATISPENVALSADASMLAVASYDGSNVSLFRRIDPGPWQPVWRRDLGLAHGVAILGQSVFATGLQARELVRLDVRTGIVLQRVGGAGWNPWRQRMLWPTSLLAFEGRLLISDAHTGLICILDVERLAPERCFGGNGPDRTHFNMPYALGIAGRSLAVTSTFQGRLLLLDLQPHGIDVTADFTGDDTGWSAEEADRAPSADRGLATYMRRWSHDDPYRGDCDLGPPLEGYTCRYGDLRGRKHPERRIAMPSTNGLLNRCGYYYFIESSRTRKGTFLLSPQNPCVLYLSVTSAGTVQMLPSEMKQASWAVNGESVSPAQAVSFDKIEHLVSATLTASESKRRGGVLLPDDAAALLLPDIGDGTERLSEFRRRLVAALPSSSGQEFAQRYLECSAAHCETSAIRALSREAQTAGADLESLYLSCFLSGAPCVQIH